MMTHLSMSTEQTWTVIDKTLMVKRLSCLPSMSALSSSKRQGFDSPSVYEHSMLPFFFRIFRIFVLCGTYSSESSFNKLECTREAFRCLNLTPVKNSCYSPHSTTS